MEIQEIKQRLTLATTLNPDSLMSYKHPRLIISNLPRPS